MACGRLLAGSPIYPSFEVTALNPPRRNAYLYHQNIHYKNWRLNPAEQELERQEYLNPTYDYYFDLLRNDPNLKSFTDSQLKETVNAALAWSAKTELFLKAFPDVNTPFAFYIEKYRLYLLQRGIDPNQRPSNFKSMLAQFGYSSLTHGTSVEGLVQILKSGEMSSVKNGGHKSFSEVGDHRYVYLEALPKYLEQFFFKRNTFTGKNLWNDPRNPFPVYIEVDTSVLDQVDWSHMGIYWNYGRVNEGGADTILSSNLLAAFFNLVRPTSNIDPALARAGFTEVSMFNARNEFTFTADISVKKFVKAIYVTPHLLEPTRAALREQGITQSLIDLVQ